MEAVMNGDLIRSDRSAIASILYVVLAAALISQAACAKELPNTEPTMDAAASEPQPLSMLDRSYLYHRSGMLPETAPYPATSPARDGGWYRYGFPAQTHRWGWFGAEHYYPRVIWHRGYYGDHCRWCYRRGY
jgi:hypothetical protein